MSTLFHWISLVCPKCCTKGVYTRSLLFEAHRPEGQLIYEGEIAKLRSARQKRWTRLIVCRTGCYNLLHKFFSPGQSLQRILATRREATNGLAVYMHSGVMRRSGSRLKRSWHARHLRRTATHLHYTDEYGKAITFRMGWLKVPVHFQAVSVRNSIFM